MKTFLLPVVVLAITCLSPVHAQRASILRKGFAIVEPADSVEIVVIKTKDIPGAVKRSLSPNTTDENIDYPTTIYTNPSNEVHVVHVNNQKNNKTYIFQKNSNVVLMLRPAKAKIEKPVNLATK